MMEELKRPCLQGGQVRLRPTRLEDLEFLQRLWNDGEAYYRAADEYCGYRALGMAELDLKLAKKLWGHGYGGDALRTLARWLFAQGFRVLVVSPNLQNKAALRLYERMGFEPKLRFRAEETGAEHEVWALREERFEP